MLDFIPELAAKVADAIPVGAAELVILTAAASGFAFFLLNKIVNPVIGRVTRSFYYTFDVTSNDPIYRNLNSWLWRNSQHVRFSRTFRSGRTADGEELVPGEGRFMVTAPGYPIMLISRSLETKDVRGTLDKLGIRMLTRRVEKVVKFHDALKDEDMPPNLVHRADYGSWDVFGTRKDVPYLMSAAAEEVEADLARFLSEEVRALYRHRGVPYRRGYLVTGPPGTGKSNLAAYLSEKFGLPIHTILGTTMSVESAASMLNNLDSKRTNLVLLEDADLSALGTKRSKVQSANDLPPSDKDPRDPGLDDDQGPRGGDPQELKADDGDDERRKQVLQAFLNALDGILKADNFVFFCTTNNVHDLDPALIRPGRLDYHVELGPLTSEEQAAYYHKFYGFSKRGEMRTLPRFKVRTAAELVHILSKHMNDPMKAAVELADPATVGKPWSRGEAA